MRSSAVPASDEPQALPSVSILMVDDRQENLLALEASLEVLGQRLVAATSGEAALRAVLDEQFAVILMDIRMPGLDGFETLALLRERERTRHIPIIFLTAHEEQGNALRSYSAGAVDFLQKPFDPDALRAKVSVFVHLRQNEVALQAARDELESRVAERTRDLAAEIERRKITEQRLIELAHRDALTRLANRKLLIEHLNQAVARWDRRKSVKFAVIMLDLDRFKVINDTYGHLAGDELLVEVAQRLQRCLRSVDTAARLGGDEFAVLVDGIDELRDATRTAERIKRALAEPFSIAGREVAISGSLGLAMIDDRYDRGEELLRDADTALYRAKEGGRNRIQVFDEELHASVLAELRNEAELGAALERHELELYYQPIVTIATGRTSSFEALLRWKHPERGLVEPARFIALAEESGLIKPIGRWVIEQACAQIAAWGMPISVNVSANQLAEPGLAAHVARALHDHSLDPHLLDIELTEHTVMTGTSASALAELRELGCPISLDDFGTGYSCLASLQSLAVSALKIDRSFIAPIGTPDERLEIVNAIVMLAHNLGLSVVGEGVETPAQLDRLRALGCERAQGYHFSRPVDAATARQLLDGEREEP